MRAIQSFISTFMFSVMVVGVPAYFLLSEDDFQKTDPAMVRYLDSRIQRNRSMPIAKMTREPSGYFDKDFNWVPFDRTRKAR